MVAAGCAVLRGDAVVALVLLVGRTTGIACQVKLSRVQKNDSEKDVRSWPAAIGPRSREGFHGTAFDEVEPSGR